MDASKPGQQGMVRVQRLDRNTSTSELGKSQETSLLGMFCVHDIRWNLSAAVGIIVGIAYLVVVEFRLGTMCNTHFWCYLIAVLSCRKRQLLEHDWLHHPKAF